MLRALSWGRAAVDSDDESRREESALKELRELLSGADGGRVAAELVQGGELDSPDELLSDAYLRRWLVAREFDVAVTHALLVAHASWRARNMPDGFVAPSRVAELAELGTAWACPAPDARGRAVGVFVARNHARIGSDVRPMRAFISLCIDALVGVCDAAANPGRRVVTIFDLGGAGAANIDVAAMTEMVKLLNTHYVERLSMLYFYDPPLVFWGFWSAFKGLVPVATRAKIELVAPGGAADGGPNALLRDLGEAATPAQYGGSAKLVPILDAAASARAALAARRAAQVAAADAGAGVSLVAAAADKAAAAPAVAVAAS